MKRVRSDHRSSLSKLLHTVMMILHHEEGQERSQEFSIQTTPHSNDDPPPRRGSGAITGVLYPFYSTQ